jgi:hypothetical protein
MDFDITLEFAGWYIAHPYWPEREQVINLEKKAGLNRVRSEERRAKALNAWLAANQMRRDQYDELVRLASRPFYTNGAAKPCIVVPAHQLHGMLAQASALAPAAVRVARLEQIRTMVQFGDLLTSKSAADGVYSRFVLVKSGTGQTLSNQRGLREDPYIAAFRAAGKVTLIDADLEHRVKNLLDWAGREIGVGAARKMGHGRFVVRTFRAAAAKAA